MPDENETARSLTETLARAKVKLALGQLSPEAYLAFSRPLERELAKLEARRVNRELTKRPN